MAFTKEEERAIQVSIESLKAIEGIEIIRASHLCGLPCIETNRYLVLITTDHDRNLTVKEREILITKAETKQLLPKQARVDFRYPKRPRIRMQKRRIRIIGVPQK